MFKKIYGLPSGNTCCWYQCEQATDWLMTFNCCWKENTFVSIML